MGLISRVSSRTYREIDRRVMLFQQALKHSISRVPVRNMGAGATKKSKDMWKMLSFTAVPVAILGTALLVYKREQAHLAHYHRPEHKIPMVVDSQQEIPMGRWIPLHVPQFSLQWCLPKRV